jgi:hypothetical protein
MSEELIVVPGFVKGRELRALLDFCWNLEYKLPPYRGKYLKRSPKATFVLDKSVGVYRFGQEKRSYSDVTIDYPDPIMKLACEIAEQFGETPNHCIVICYSDGKEHHIPWHSDKQEGTQGAGAKDICSSTNIYNIIIFEDEDGTKENRKFQVAYPEDIEEKPDGHGDARKYVYNKRTPNGDMIVLTAEGNMAMKHRVPKEKGNNVVRYSIVFRTIKMKEDQGLECEDDEEEAKEEADDEADDEAYKEEYNNITLKEFIILKKQSEKYRRLVDAWDFDCITEDSPLYAINEIICGNSDDELDEN